MMGTVNDMWKRLEGMTVVERLMGGDSETPEERAKLVRLANAAPELLSACEGVAAYLLFGRCELCDGDKPEKDDPILELYANLSAAIAAATDE